MMKRFFRTFLLALLVAIVALSLASCANSNAAPEDASGVIGDIKWSYTKSDKTLIISGSGEIVDFGGYDSVPWKGVRTAVETLKFSADEGKSFTKIGSYAFYGMSSLKSVSIPEGVLSIGECSFAFCSSATDINMPSTLTSVGASAFEACASLKTLEIPASVTSIGESAFAFCRSLESTKICGAVEKIEKWTFRDCVALELIRVDSVEVPENAYEGAVKMNKDGIRSLRTSVVSVTCQDEEGNVIGGSEGVAVLEVGEEKPIAPPTIEGYEFAEESPRTETGTGEPISVVYKYRKIVAADEAPEQTEDATEAPAGGEDEKDGVTAFEIISIAIFAVVIAGIVVGAVLLMRSDKKTTRDSMTVRKNNVKKGKK